MDASFTIGRSTLKEENMGERDDPEFRWLERGDSEAVLLLHGLMGRMDHWEECLEILGDICRPLALTLPIFDPALAETSIPELGRHVRRFLDALEIDSHPDTLYRHEPDSGGRLDRIPLLPPADPAIRYRAIIEGFVRSLPGHRSAKVSASLPVFPKSYYGASRFMVRRATVLAAKAAAKVFGECPAPTFVSASARSRLHIVWKSIESIGRLGLLVRALPTCHAILVLRHPCGYIASVARGEVGDRFTDRHSVADDEPVLRMLLATPQARARELSLGRLRRLSWEERLAWRWVLFNEKALEETSGLATCTYVRYEDICADPTSAIRQLFRFAGLSWHPQTAAFLEASTSRDSGGYYSVFKDPARSARAWRDELPPDSVARVLGVLRHSRLASLYVPE
jgi:hypothetical protein